MEQLVKKDREMMVLNINIARWQIFSSKMQKQEYSPHHLELKKSFSLKRINSLYIFRVNMTNDIFSIESIQLLVLRPRFIQYREMTAYRSDLQQPTFSWIKSLLSLQMNITNSNLQILHCPRVVVHGCVTFKAPACLFVMDDYGWRMSYYYSSVHIYCNFHIPRTLQSAM